MFHDIYWWDLKKKYTVSPAKASDYLNDAISGAHETTRQENKEEYA